MEDSDVMDISSLIHRRWTDAFDTLKAVKAEKDDGSPDWAEFHEVRFEVAQAEEWHWSQLKQRFMTEHKAVFDRLF